MNYLKKDIKDLKMGSLISIAYSRGMSPAVVKHISKGGIINYYSLNNIDINNSIFPRWSSRITGSFKDNRWMHLDKNCLDSDGQARYEALIRAMDIPSEQTIKSLF